jgi:hypothetical protein
VATRLRQPFQGIGHHAMEAGLVTRQRVIAQEGHLGAMGAGHLGDALGVGRHHHAVKQARIQGGTDRAANHRHATEGADVLVRNALAATAGRNNCNIHDKTLMLLSKILTINS